MIEFVELLLNNDIADNMYLYEFAGTANPYYTPHGADLAFLWNDSYTSYYTFNTPWNQDLSDYWRNIWNNFIISGDMISGESYNIDGSALIFKDSSGYIQGDYINHYRNGVCDWWNNQVNYNIRYNLALQIGITVDNIPTTTTTPYDDISTTDNGFINISMYSIVFIVIIKIFLM